MFELSKGMTLSYADLAIPGLAPTKTTTEAIVMAARKTPTHFADMNIAKQAEKAAEKIIIMQDEVIGV